MDINGPGKSWKMHTKRSWKVMDKHIQCSVCTLLIVWLTACQMTALHACLFSTFLRMCLMWPPEAVVFVRTDMIRFLAR